MCVSVFVPGHYPAILINAYELRWIRCPFILLSGYMSLLLPVGCVYLFRGNWRENLGGNEVYPLMAAPLRAGLSSTASQHHIARMLILYPGGQIQLQASSSLWWPWVWSNRLCVCVCARLAVQWSSRKTFQCLGVLCTPAVLLPGPPERPYDFSNTSGI